MFPHFQKYLNPQVRTKKLVNSVFYHPYSSRLASGIPFLYFFKLLRVLSLQQNACWISSDLYIPTCAGKIFQFMVFTFLENHWTFAFLLMPQSPTQNSWLNFLKIYSHKTKGVEEAMICSIKIQSENMKMTWNISLFPFGMIAIFLNVMTLQLCKQYQIVWY